MTFKYNVSVENFKHEDGLWKLDVKEAEPLIADRVIMATGGLSFPAVGTDGTGHRLVKRVRPYALFAGHTDCFHDTCELVQSLRTRVMSSWYAGTRRCGH